MCRRVPPPPPPSCFCLDGGSSWGAGLGVPQREAVEPVETSSGLRGGMGRGAVVGGMGCRAGWDRVEESCSHPAGPSSSAAFFAGTTLSQSPTATLLCVGIAEAAEGLCLASAAAGWGGGSAVE